MAPDGAAGAGCGLRSLYGRGQADLGGQLGGGWGLWVQLVSAAVWIPATSVPFLLSTNGGERTKRQSALCIKLKLTQIASKIRSANCSRVIFRPRVTLQ